MRGNFLNEKLNIDGNRVPYPAKSTFWSLNFITINIVRYKKQHNFTTVLYFLIKIRTLVYTSVHSVQTDFGALDIFRAMIAKVSNPMG